MSKWISVNKKLPRDGKIVWALFKSGRKEMVMYTPNYIAHLCREEEGRWRGMGSTDEENWTHWAVLEPPD